MMSSSESMGLAVVSGVGGAAAAEANLLLDCDAEVEDSTASAAFLFLGLDEMVSFAEVLELVRKDESPGT